MKTQLATIFLCATISTGCAIENLSGEVYTREDARKLQTIETGVIVAANEIIIEGETDGLGTSGGAVLGGMAGASTGDGLRGAAASAIGAIAGGVAGQKAEERLTRRKAQELTVRRDNSADVIVLVQEIAEGVYFSAGDKVRLITSDDVIRVRY